MDNKKSEARPTGAIPIFYTLPNDKFVFEQLNTFGKKQSRWKIQRKLHLNFLHCREDHAPWYLSVNASSSVNCKISRATCLQCWVLSADQLASDPVHLLAGPWFSSKLGAKRIKKVKKEAKEVFKCPFSPSWTESKGREDKIEKFTKRPFYRGWSVRIPTDSPVSTVPPDSRKDVHSFIMWFLDAGNWFENSKVSLTDWLTNQPTDRVQGLEKPSHLNTC